MEFAAIHGIQPCHCAKRAPSPALVKRNIMRGTDRTPVSLATGGRAQRDRRRRIEADRHRRADPVRRRRGGRGFRHQFRHSGSAVFGDHADGRRVRRRLDPVRAGGDPGGDLQARAAVAGPHRLLGRPDRHAGATNAAVPHHRRVRDAVRRDRSAATLRGHGAAAFRTLRHDVAAIGGDRGHHAAARDHEPERDDAAADDDRGSPGLADDFRSVPVAGLLAGERRRRGGGDQRAGHRARICASGRSW